MILNFKKFFSKKPKSWNNLSLQEKENVTRRLTKIINAVSGPNYHIVSPPYEYQRERGQIEKRGEDEILHHSLRGKLLDLTRNANRNSSQLCTILKQFDLWGVTKNGGKAIISFEDSEYSKEVKNAFAEYTRNCDFYDGMNLNSLLKLIVRELIVGGDVVLIFDDNLVTDSGKLMLFESDEIGDIPEQALIERYGIGATQSQGRIYDSFHRYIGAVVSKSQRGLEVFDPKQSYLLKRNPDNTIFDDYFIFPRNIWRMGQGRGTSPLVSTLGNLIDINDFLEAERAASKANSKIFATITHTEKENDVIDIPSTFDASDLDLDNMTDEQLQELVNQQKQEQPTMSLDKLNSAGILYQILPDHYKAEITQPGHPNSNAIQFVQYLTNLCGSPLGLTSMFSNLKVDKSYSGFRGESLLVQPAFEEVQKFLENQVLDWVFYRFVKWAIRKGKIEDKLPENFMSQVSFLWQKIPDADSVKEQNAIALKMKNNTATLQELIGSDFKEKLQQISREIKLCKELGIPHPSLQTVSGAIIETDKTEETESENESDEEN